MAMTQSGATARANTSRPQIDLGILASDIAGIAGLLYLATELTSPRRSSYELELKCNLLRAARSQVEEHLAVIGDTTDEPLNSVGTVLADVLMAINHATATARTACDGELQLKLYWAQLGCASAAAKHASHMLAAFAEDSESEVA